MIDPLGLKPFWLRSYPYTGPGASPSQPQSQQTSTSTTPSNLQTPDYSSYGYGGNNALMAGNASAGLSQEAQQAQWHQQWQQVSRVGGGEHSMPF